MAQQRNNLWHRKDAETDDHKLQPVCQVGDVIGCHAQRAAGIGLTDGADQHAEARRRQTFERDAPSKNGDHGQAEDRDHQHFGQTEGQHKRSRHNNEHRQEGRSHQTAKEGRGERRRERACRLAFLGQGEAVEHGGL